MVKGPLSPTQLLGTIFGTIRWTSADWVVAADVALLNSKFVIKAFNVDENYSGSGSITSVSFKAGPGPKDFGHYTASYDVTGIPAPKQQAGVQEPAIRVAIAAKAEGPSAGMLNFKPVQAMPVITQAALTGELDFVVL